MCLCTPAGTGADENLRKSHLEADKQDPVSVAIRCTHELEFFVLTDLSRCSFLFLDFPSRFSIYLISTVGINTKKHSFWMDSLAVVFHDLPKDRDVEMEAG